MSSIERRLIKKTKNISKKLDEAQDLYQYLESLKNYISMVENLIEENRYEIDGLLEYFHKKDAQITDLLLDLEDGEVIHAFLIKMNQGKEWIGIYEDTIVKAKVHPEDTPVNEVGIALVKNRLRIALLEKKYY